MQAPDPVPPTRVWVAHKTIYSAVEGRLELVDGRVTLTVTEGNTLTGKTGRRTADWLEELSGRSGASEALQRGEPVSVLDVPVGEVGATWPKISFGAFARLDVHGTRWDVQFYSPTASVLGLFELPGARRAARPWRAALGGGSPPDEPTVSPGPSSAPAG